MTRSLLTSSWLTRAVRTATSAGGLSRADATAASATARPLVTCAAASRTAHPAAAENSSTAWPWIRKPPMWAPPFGSSRLYRGRVSITRPRVHSPKLTPAATALNGSRTTA